MNFGGPEMIVVLVVVLVLFGGSQLPKLARNLGKAQKEFKDGLAEANKDGAAASAPAPAMPPPPAPPASTPIDKIDS